MTKFVKKVRLLLKQPKKHHSLDRELESRLKSSKEKHFLLSNPRVR